MGDVSIFAAFLAGLVSFLSPCVLPLVPGYVSMLSGIGVEQLSEGEGNRASVLGSAFAFVLGFSIVFITFGASASAVGEFLLKNRTLLAPVAGSFILLFGLHLTGVLAKISIFLGALIGAVFVAGGILVAMKPGVFGERIRPVHFFSVSVIFFLGPFLTRWLNRDIHFRTLGGEAWRFQRFSSGICVRLRMDAVHRADSRCGAGDGCDKPDDLAGRVSAGGLFRGPRDSVSSHCDRDWQIS